MIAFIGNGGGWTEHTAAPPAHRCTCNDTGIEPCKAQFHYVEPSTVAEAPPRNRQERRANQRAIRKKLRSDAIFRGSMAALQQHFRRPFR